MKMTTHFIFRIFHRKVLIPDGLPISDSGIVRQIPAIKGLRGKILRNKELAIEDDGWDVGVPLSELGDSGRIWPIFLLYRSVGKGYSSQEADLMLWKKRRVLQG